MLFFLLALGTPRITFAAGYIPNVQFLPFYVAQERGYYRAAGIEVNIDYTSGPEVYKLVAQGRIDVAAADPDALFHACHQGMPLLHVATLYQSYPIALISRKPVVQPQDLVGIRIGISGTFGSSYLGLKAMCQQLGADFASLELVTVGYNQVQALRTGHVTSIVGYANHEPVRLRLEGIETNLYQLSRQNALPGVGFMVNRNQWNSQPVELRAFLAATFRGVVDVVLSPKETYSQIAPRYLPGADANPQSSPEFQVLLATLPYWSTRFTGEHGFGQADSTCWDNLLTLLADQLGPQRPDWRPWVDLSFRWQPGDLALQSP
jgi:NitT/TauT family transport system substrate-binding protein